MLTKTVFRYLISALLLLSAAVLPGHAQVITSGLTGVVRGADGKVLVGASVTAVHVPTNTTFKAVTNASGRYYMRGLPVGGPYTVTATAEGYHTEKLEEISTQLGQDTDANVTLGSDVVQLEKFEVTGQRNALDSTAIGTAIALTPERLEARPTTQRSLADFASLSPLVTLRALSGDREEAMITAAGQNNRFNSWFIDGNRINDQFGLNSTGLASFFNPLANDAMEQMSVEITNYDVRYSGYTGAMINVVTKSGSNEFHGSAYYIFSGDHLAGVEMQGPDERTRVASGIKITPTLERTTKGLTFGGPLWKDHIFFFLNWEKFNRIGAPNSAGLPVVNSAALSLIDAKVASLASSTGIDYGTLGGNANSIATDEKKLFKIDWNITDQHRLSARYSTTEGQVPQFGSFTTTSLGTGSDVTPNTLVGGATTAYDSHFYAQKRLEKSYSAQLVSNWTPDLKTELKWSHVKQDQYTPVNLIAPEIDIFGVSGVNQQGANVTNGVVVLGAERFRHGNQINVDTKNYSANADYTLGNFTFSAGADLEDNNYYNLFRQYSYGVFQFANPTAFANNQVLAFQRNFTDLAIKGSYADISQYTQTGIFGEVKWDVSNRLNLLAGVRYDWSTSDTRPVFNPTFFKDTGMRNDGTVDGADEISPRAGFNLSLDDERKTQIRGGGGYFVGRAPWVFWSNSYGQTGAGTYTVNAIPTGGLDSYLSSFDQTNPMGTGTQTGTARSEIDLSDDKMHMPSLWRMNLAVDHKLSFLDTTVTAEVIHSINDHTIFITNDNLKVKGIAADGRTYFAGNPGTAANALYPNYTNIFHIRNVRAGEATYATISWDRPLKDKWGFNLSYTRGRSTEAQAAGQTTASGMWQRNAVFNQSQVETGTSDFEVKDRVQASLVRQFEFIKKYKTTASLNYEGRSGSPYSFAYANDLNADGMSGNDLVAVPTGADDARYDFSKMTAAQVATYLKYSQTGPLSKYAGSYAPKNAFYQPWINRLDLQLSQDIPLHLKKAKLKLELDFTNFGSFLSHSLFNYVYRAPSTVNDVFDRRLVTSTQINTATGKLQPQLYTATFRNTTTGATSTRAIYDNDPVVAPTGSTVVSVANAMTSTADFLIDNTMSRWRVQVQAKLSF